MLYQKKNWIFPKAYQGK